MSDEIERCPAGHVGHVQIDIEPGELPALLEVVRGCLERGEAFHLTFGISDGDLATYVHARILELAKVN